MERDHTWGPLHTRLLFPSIRAAAERLLVISYLFHPQMQQINFMSLMQVVGSSFAAIPALQHVLQQTAQIGRNPVLNPMGESYNPPPSRNAAVPDPQREADVIQTGTDAEEMARSERSNKENLQVSSSLFTACCL